MGILCGRLAGLYGRPKLRKKKKVGKKSTDNETAGSFLLRPLWSEDRRNRNGDSRIQILSAPDTFKIRLARAHQ